MHHKIMKQILTLLLLWMHLTVLSNHPYWADGELIGQSAQVTYSIFQRYCILAQASAHIESLENAYESTSHLPHYFYQNIAEYKEHSLLNDYLCEVDRVKSLEPFFDACQWYKSYQLIDDESINQQFISLVKQITSLFLSLPDLEEYHKKALSKFGCYNVGELSSESMINIIFRYYFLKRIKNSVKYIIQYCNNNNTLSLPDIEFTHKDLNDALRAMRESSDTKLYYDMYKILQQYYFLDNFLLQHDFLILTCLLMQHAKNDTCDEEDIQIFKHASIKELLDFLNNLEFGDTSNFSSIQGTSHQIQEKYNECLLSDIIESEFNFTKEEFCNFVMRRYYLIKRFSFMDDIQIQNTVGKKEKVRPLLSDWKRFKRYMFLSDQLFIDTFADELFLIADSRSDHTVVTQLAEKKQALILSDNLKQQDFSEVQLFADIDTITLRFYYIKRLKNSIEKVNAFKDLKLLKIDAYSGTINFFHPIVNNCFQEIQKQHSLLPFLALTDSFKSYFYIHDELFLKEYLILLSLCQVYLLVNFGTSIDSSKKKTKI